MATVGTEQDVSYLRRALELAEGGRGRVSPNPLVGAVIVRDGEVDRRGLPRRARRAARRARRRSRTPRARGADPAGATIYVTLEPCAHTGRQPPCTEAILEAGISRVVYASEDPTEKASGRGPGMLRDGGVEVELAGGPEAAAARLLNQPFRKRARTGRPLVTSRRRCPSTAASPRRPATPAGSRASRAASSSTAGAPSPTPSRSGSAPRSPTTRCSTARIEGAATPARPGRLRLRAPGCRSTPRWSPRSTRRR